MTSDELTALLKGAPRTLVGDGKSPNIFFVTSPETGDTLAVFMGKDFKQDAIAFTNNHDVPLTVEDRLSGVVHDNPAAEHLQDRLEEAEGEGDEN
jgi:hypothetical protein